MKKLLFLSAIFLVKLLTAQNLVPNPSFETFTSCPSTASQLFLASPWFQPGTGTPDLLTKCATNTFVGVPKNAFGHQNAHTGSSYSGIFDFCGDYREYIEVPLTTSLISGTKYYLSFYVSLGDTAAYTSSSIGAYLSNTILSVSNFSPITVIPQIQNPINNYYNNTNWKKTSGSFVAQGGEKYLTIGNFNSTATTNSMIVNTNTLVYNKSCIYFYIDDVCLSKDSLYNENWLTLGSESNQNQIQNIKIFPNPTNDKMRILFNKNESFNLEIYDSSLNLILKLLQVEDGEIDISTLRTGTYFFRIITPDYQIYRTLIKI